MSENLGRKGLRPGIDGGGGKDNETRALPTFSSLCVHLREKGILVNPLLLSDRFVKIPRQFVAWMIPDVRS